jgi:hypothetical protein
VHRLYHRALGVAGVDRKAELGVDVSRLDVGMGVRLDARR